MNTSLSEPKPIESQNIYPATNLGLRFFRMYPALAAPHSRVSSLAMMVAILFDRHEEFVPLAENLSHRVGGHLEGGQSVAREGIKVTRRIRNPHRAETDTPRSRA